MANAAVSPDGRNRIDCDGGRITIRRDGRTLFGPQAVALALDRGTARVELVARNDGVAYRFVTDEDGALTVRDETAELVFPSSDTEIWTGLNWCDNPSDPKQDKLQHGCSSIYSRLTPATFPPDGRRLAYLPLTVRFADGTTALVTESDLRDYAGLHLRRDGTDTNRLKGVSGKYPVVEKERPEYKQYRRVTERHDYIVKTRGRRTFPWRVFALADRPIGIVEQRIVRDLAAPASGDWSWVRPGPCAWEWWNACHLEDVPFKPGINTATYCAYADFAADYCLPWMLVDEGWNDGLDLRKIVPAFDLDAIVRHAAARKVQVMLWTAWRTIDGRQEDYFAHFAQLGVKGFKIDFMERDDAEMVNFMERTLQVAAKYRLCIDFHGSGKPTGLERTYPNLIGMEGVHGLELMKLGMARNDDFLTHDCQVVFTRAPLGMLDYTPGAMCNRLRKDWKPDFANPCSQGTRVRQLALYTLFPVPLQMLCDSPSRYRRNPECARFIASVPTVWDETKGLCGEIGRYAAVARRRGSEWWIGAITDAEPRTLAIDTSFLGGGRWRAEVFADADDAGVRPEHWRRTVVEFAAGESLSAKLASGGGWTASITLVSQFAGARPKPRPALLERIKDGIEVYGIVHWGLNTYTDREWGYGNEDPKMLNPDCFDADQIVGACKDGGLQGLIVVAKHHDGFCLWPTKTTEHNITKSPFRGGKGDYVKEMELACRRHGLKFGVYVSPWDRNRADYATPKYVETFHAQIKELLSGDYGEVFEMWFDGANGGDGWYGGAKETRKIPLDYYRFDEVFKFVRELQPKVCIFNEADGADYRWPGNERGELCDDSAATIRPYDRKVYRSCCNRGDLKDGTTFHPPECDFPLRKGWFYHLCETNTVRCGEYLMQRYLNTVGNGGTMNIGIAPDKHGRLAPEDVAALKRFGELKKEFFARTGDEQGRCNVIVLSEDVSNGELVDSWKVTASGKTIASGSGLGIKRIRVLPQPIVKADIKPVEFTHLREGGLPDGYAIEQMFYYVEPKTLNRVMNATTTNGETDTAQWMTGK